MKARTGVSCTTDDDEHDDDVHNHHGDWWWWRGAISLTSESSDVGKKIVKISSMHILSKNNDKRTIFFRLLCVCLHNNHTASHTNGNLLEGYSTKDMAPARKTSLSMSIFYKSDCQCNYNCMDLHSPHPHHLHNGRSSLAHTKYKSFCQWILATRQGHLGTFPSYCYPDQTFVHSVYTARVPA